MLTLYRSHTRSCGQKDRYYRRCKMPGLGRGDNERGEYIRRSLKLTSWERGEEKKRELEAGPALVASTAQPEEPTQRSQCERRPRSSARSARPEDSPKRRCGSTARWANKSRNLRTPAVSIRMSSRPSSHASSGQAGRMLHSRPERSLNVSVPFPLRYGKRLD